MNAASLPKSTSLKTPRISLVFLFLFIITFSACRRSSEELPVLPPITHPLVRDYIGYGVVNASFTHLLSEPGPGGVSRGYIRRGTVVRILERRPIAAGRNSESWILVEGNYQSSRTQSSQALSPGWLQETTVEVYDNESRAITASKVMSQ